LTKKYPALWNNGTWMVRDKKGGNGLTPAEIAAL